MRKELSLDFSGITTYSAQNRSIYGKIIWADDNGMTIEATGKDDFGNSTSLTESYVKSANFNYYVCEKVQGKSQIRKSSASEFWAYPAGSGIPGCAGCSA